MIPPAKLQQTPTTLEFRVKRVLKMDRWMDVQKKNTKKKIKKQNKPNQKYQTYFLTYQAHNSNIERGKKKTFSNRTPLVPLTMKIKLRTL